MTARISVIIPTIGRPSLAAAEASAAGADEVIVVPDNTGDHGYTARRKGMAQATGTHLAFLDDDDIYAPGALTLMREAACDRPVIFRMDHPRHGILWRDPVLEFGNVGTPMFLVPNRPEHLGEWKAHAPGLAEPGGDYTFIRGCVDNMGDPVWRPEVTAIIRPARGPSITIVTPWLDHLELAPDYMTAVAVRNASDRVIVVDNASDPPLADALPAGWVTRTDTNLGFSAASNLGLEHADTDAVLFLNNDVAATGLDWLDRIRAALEPGVLIGAELRNDPHSDVDGVPFPYLDGWCLAGMTADLRALGGWDETYAEPSYFGDNDLCLRARLEGFALRETRVPLLHKRNATSGGAENQAVRAATEANHRKFIERAREALEVTA